MEYFTNIDIFDSAGIINTHDAPVYRSSKLIVSWYYYVSARKLSNIPLILLKIPGRNHQKSSRSICVIRNSMWLCCRLVKCIVLLTGEMRINPLWNWSLPLPGLTRRQSRPRITCYSSSVDNVEWRCMHTICLDCTTRE